MKQVESAMTLVAKAISSARARFLEPSTTFENHVYESIFGFELVCKQTGRVRQIIGLYRTYACDMSDMLLVLRKGADEIIDEFDDEFRVSVPEATESYILRPTSAPESHGSASQQE